MRYVFIAILLLLIAMSVSASGAEEKAYMGIYSAVVTDLPDVEGAPKATGGIRIDDVREDAPAYKGGLRLGDIVIAFGDYVFDVPEAEIDAKFKSIIDGYHPGDKMPVTVLRMEITRKLISNGFEIDSKPYMKDPAGFVADLPDKSDIEMSVHKEYKLLHLVITLGTRNEFKFPAPPEIEDTNFAGMFAESEWKPWIEEGVDRYDIRAEYDDLRARLRNLHLGDDGYRNPLVAAIHRDPYIAESVARKLTDPSQEFSNFNELSFYVTGRHYKMESNESPSMVPADFDKDKFKVWFEGNMQQFYDSLDDVYGVFNDDEKKFLMEHRFELTDVFAENIYIHTDEDLDRLARNKRTIELGDRLDLTELANINNEVGAFNGMTSDDVFLWMEKHPDVRSIETKWGKIGFGTKGRDWWRESDYKFVYDPAGDDVYSDGTATANSFDKPISWVIDMGGDDAYQSTASNGAQGSGCPGIGFLFDTSGNDIYIGQRWAQGTGFMGIGYLEDCNGNDEYHGNEFVQGSGMFGIGILKDFFGDDSYFGTIHAQGCGFTDGMGVLFDFMGNDKGYATGKLPTNYGDPGIFDAWSQGCGMGFRGIASGGIGMLIDNKGDDRWEAGNFSQGGGYYYGMGIFRAYEGNDTYIGSRYAQGFCAHQAIGVFIDDSGNDYYTTRQGVNAGLAWDECVAVFIDGSGDDYYNGGSGFSLGASAHNSIMFWWDKAGKDYYEYAAGPARAGGNDYHGGYSLSFFVDSGDEHDTYTCTTVSNDEELAWPEYGIFRDGKGELKSPLKKPEVAK